MSTISRRDILKMMGATPFAAVPFRSEYDETSSRYGNETLKVMVTGAHPDDPETGCGGIIARYAEAGHEVVNLYLTRGEGGIPGKSNDEAAEIRTGEAHKASEILGARPRFVGQIDGDTKVTNEAYKKVRTIMEEEDPDLLFTQWPVDSHRDHRAISAMVYDAWLGMGKKIPLYYYEVMSGIQTQAFNPTDYVDITAVEPVKRKACYAHESQKPGELYPVHERMSRFRGMEFRCEHAEAFVRHEQSPSFSLIGANE